MKETTSRLFRKCIHHQRVYYPSNHTFWKIVHQSFLKFSEIISLFLKPVSSSSHLKTMMNLNIKSYMPLKIQKIPKKVDTNIVSQALPPVPHAILKRQPILPIPCIFPEIIYEYTSLALHILLPIYTY